MKTLYLWDLANTLFTEKWDKEKTGVDNFDEYVESLGYNLKNISPIEYERCYEKPYGENFYQLGIAEGFQEVLSWTSDNEVFTTGNREQIDWRARNFINRGLFDIRPYFKKINTTFDFANTNKKTKEVVVELLKGKVADGYTHVVYTDDRLDNCRLFMAAAEAVAGLQTRIYQIMNDASGISKKDGYWVVGNLFNLMKNEKNLRGG